jgi:glycosyltransferase involved in cell wall biosynthesis
MKRILYVVPDFYPNASGYANACVNFVYGIAAPGFDLHILSFHPVALPRQLAGLSLHVIANTPVPAMNEAIERELAGRWDAVIFETFENADVHNRLLDRLDVDPGAIAVRIHAATETELYVSGRSIHYDQQFLEAKRLARRVQSIWSTTDYYLDFFRRHYCDSLLSVYEKKYAKVPNFNSFIGAETLISSTLVSDLVASLGTRSIMLAMGRMSWQGIHQKNFINLIDAVYLARESLSTCHIVLIGDGAYRCHLQNQIYALGLQSLITVIPRLEHSDVRWLMSQAHAGILISKYEGHSMFCAECQELGLPLLYSANTALDEIVVDEVSGIRVIPDDVLSLANGLATLSAFTPRRDDVIHAYRQQCHLDELAARTRALIELLTLPLQKPKACVFGTGSYYASVRDIIRASYKVHCFADNNAQLHGQLFDGSPIVSPQQIATMEIDIIIVASSFYGVIKQQLTEIGLDPHNIFFVQQADVFNNPVMDA